MSWRVATDTADKMIASEPDKITEPASDIAAVDGNATAPFDSTSYVIADGDLANGKLATSIFQMVRSLATMY